MSFLPPVVNGQIVIKHKKPKKTKSEKKFAKIHNKIVYQRIPTKYKKYIKSKWWVKRKRAYYAKFGKKCAVCLTKYGVDLHHAVYGKLGFEKDEHLIALCRQHHESFHDKVGVKGNMLKETLEFIDEERQLLEFTPLTTWI